MDDDNRRAWDRMPGEPEAWYLRFRRYALLGQGRTFLRVYNAERAEKGVDRTTDLPGSWRTKTEIFKWKERAAAYDVYRVEREKRAAERARREYLKREIKLADSLIKKAEQMLQFPLARTEQATETADGRTVNRTIIMPARWTMRDAAQIIETADKLMRLAHELETERTTSDVVIGESIEEIRKRRWNSAMDAIHTLISDPEIAPNGNGNGNGHTPAENPPPVELE